MEMTDVMYVTKQIQEKEKGFFIHASTEQQKTDW